MYNVAIIGAGPAGIFSALEIIKLRPDWKIILIEKGQKLKRGNVRLEKVLRNVLTADAAGFCADGAVQERFQTAN